MASKLSQNTLADRLENLSESEFRRLCSRLLRDGTVPLDALKSDRRKLADHLVLIFTEEGALKVTEEILSQVNYDHEAISGNKVLVALQKKKKKKKKKKKRRWADGAQGHMLDQRREEFIDHVRDVEPILDELLSRGIIDQENYDEISALPTSKYQMMELLGLLKSDGDKGILYNIIMEKQPLLEFRHQGQIKANLNLKSESEGPRVELQSSAGGPEIQTVSPKMIKVTTILIRSPRLIKLEPEVNVDAAEAPVYSLQSEAGQFECRVSGLRWVCKEQVSFRYHFGSWEEHMGRLETMQFVPGGPLIDITVISGQFDEVYLPHWICTEDIPRIFKKFRVLHVDTCGVYVEQVSEVTPSHVKLSQPVFCPRGVLMRAGFPVKINCKVLIYKTNKAFLTLHVYLIPHDPALQQTIINKELSSGSKTIPKPYPQKSLKMRDRFVLSADVDGAEVYPANLKLRYDGCDPNFFEVFIENPDKHFLLTLGHESVPVWTCAVRQNDYKNASDFQVKFEEELGSVRSQLVRRLSREVINQLLDDLMTDQVLNVGEKDLIVEENSTSADRARCLVDMVKRKGREASRRMFTHLRSRDPALSAELELPCGLPV